MAREWLLRGVDPEELKAKPKDEVPQTPQSRWDNFWYHHKLKFWLILFAAVVAVTAIVQMVTRDTPDYRVLLITETAYPQNELDALATMLEAYGTDIDGDGKVEIQVENCLYGKQVDQSRNSGVQQVQAHLVAGDRMFFMWEPNTYRSFMRSLSSEGEEITFLTPLSVESKRLIEDGTVYNWKGDPRPVEELTKRAPQLYFGVRLPQGTAAGSQELHEQSLALLENFIADKKTAE
ncbi:MAG: hypothetical protein IJN04_04900 [Clostridia bacterium]|nr:hypothetical protein [Clostridia bacterium]